MVLRILQYADLEGAYDEPERIGRLAGLIGELRDEETLVVGAGDNFAPGVLSLATEGRQALDFFAAVEPAADTFGNHDFDYGPEAARSVVRESPMPWVCANVYADGEPFGRDAGVVPWLVAEAGEHRVGIVGVATPETAFMTPVGAADVEFRDPVDAASEALSAVRAEGVDHAVVLSHLGAADDDLAEALDVEVVLGGHDHDERVTRVDGTLLVRPGAVGSGLAEVVFEDRPRAFRHPIRGAPVDEDVAASLRDRYAATELDEPVARVAEPVRVTDATANCAESRVGNFVTDAYRRAAGADVAIMTPYGIRAGPQLDDEVTAADVIGLVPFDNELVTVRLAGSDLRHLARNLALAQYADLDRVPDRYFGHVSGCRLVWDDEAHEIRSFVVDGDPVEADETYTVAATDYLAHSTHMVDAFDVSHVVDRHGPQHEALVEYARANGVDPQLEGRIERPALDGTA